MWPGWMMILWIAGAVTAVLVWMILVAALVVHLRERRHRPPTSAPSKADDTEEVTDDRVLVP